MNIAVILGGISSERDVSYKSGFAVGQALESKGHTVQYIDPALGDACQITLRDATITPEAPEAHADARRSFLDAFQLPIWDQIDCAFDVVHGTLGEDGHLQTLLELRGVPYTSSRPGPCHVAMDKVLSKLLFVSAGVLTPEWLVFDSDAVDDIPFIKEVIGQLGRALVVKPKDQGSAVGVHVLPKADPSSLQAALADCSRFGPKILIEQYIPGRELTVGVYGDDTFPVVEIVPREGFYDYKNKYQKGSTEYHCPADIPEDIADFTRTMAHMAHSVLGCRHYSRVDFRLNDEGQPFCLEVNTVPGFTELSLFPMGAREAGIDFPELCESLVQMAIGEIK